MLWLKLAFADTIHPKSRQFVTDVKVEVMGDLKLTLYM